MKQQEPTQLTAVRSRNPQFVIKNREAVLQTFGRHLEEAARGLPDNFNEEGNPNLRNKAAAQYKVTYNTRPEPVKTDVFGYHSGQDFAFNHLYKLIRLSKLTTSPADFGGRTH